MEVVGLGQVMMVRLVGVEILKEIRFSDCRRHLYGREANHLSNVIWTQPASAWAAIIQMVVQAASGG